MLVLLGAAVKLRPLIIFAVKIFHNIGPLGRKIGTYYQEYDFFMQFLADCRASAANRCVVKIFLCFRLNALNAIIAAYAANFANKFLFD